MTTLIQTQPRTRLRHSLLQASSMIDIIWEIRPRRMDTQTDRRMTMRNAVSYSGRVASVLTHWTVSFQNYESRYYWTI